MNDKEQGYRTPQDFTVYERTTGTAGKNNGPRWWKIPAYGYLGIRAVLADAGIVGWKNDPRKLTRP